MQILSPVSYDPLPTNFVDSMDKAAQFVSCALQIAEGPEMAQYAADYAETSMGLATLGLGYKAPNDAVDLAKKGVSLLTKAHTKLRAIPESNNGSVPEFYNSLELMRKAMFFFTDASDMARLDKTT